MSIISAMSPPIVRSQTSPPPAHSDRALYNRVGLVNQGATCYLNSLLQVLFHLPYFKSAVYRCIGDDAAAASTSPIPAALQELFFQLEECNHAPKTEALTKSFGWSDHEVLQQHDIHELLTLLRDELENRMKGTPSQNALNRLFEGKIENYIATLDGSYVSRRPEVFFDIQLEVAGHRSVMDSLRSLVKKDQLTGDNKYKVEEEGKPAVFKDAEKGLTYTRFPPVLCFHLQRFEMDLMSPNLDMRKINDRFDFSVTLDLRELEQGEKPTANEGDAAPPPAIPIKEEGAADDDNASDVTNSQKNSGATAPPLVVGSPSSPAAAATGEEFSQPVPPIYDLHSVIVHKGTVNNGHYYCYVREVKEKKKLAKAGGEEGTSPLVSDGQSGVVDPSSAAAKSMSLSSSNSAGGNNKPNNGESASSSSSSSAAAPATAPLSKAKPEKEDYVHVSISATTKSEDLDFEEGGQWYEFDDDYVRKVSEYDAVHCNFGGRTSGGQIINNNAYMLTYIRRGFWSSVMKPIPTDEIPQRVKDEFRRVMSEEDARRREIAEEGTRCYINVVDDSHIFDHVRRHSFDLISTSTARGGELDFDIVPGAFDSTANTSQRFHTLVMNKQDHFSALYDQLQDKFGYDKNNIRLRSWHYHFPSAPKDAYRPAEPLVSFDECSGTIEDVLRQAKLVPLPTAAANATTATNNNSPSRRGASQSESKPYKVFLYVEQQRIIPLSSIPAANFGQILPKGVAAADETDEEDAAVDAATAKQQRSHNQNKNATIKASPLPFASHSGLYSKNILASTPAETQLFADAVASSSLPTTNSPLKILLQMSKPIGFAPRDNQPTLVACLEKARVLEAVALRLAVAKSAMRANYSVTLEAFADVEAYQKKKVAYRLTSKPMTLPDGDSYGSTFVLVGDAARLTQISSTPVCVFSIIVKPSTSQVPTVFVTLQGLYANEMAEASLVLASKKLQLEALNGGTTPATTTTEDNAAANKERRKKTTESKDISTLESVIAYLESDPRPQLSTGPVLPRLQFRADTGECSSLLLMIKGFAPNPANGEHVRYLGPLLVERREPLITYADHILHLMGVPVDQISSEERRKLAKTLRFYDEMRTSSISPINPLTPISGNDFLNGNVIIVERTPAVTSSLYRCPSIMSFWEAHSRRVFLNIRLRVDPLEPLFQCVMDRGWSYHQVCECIATRAAEYLAVGGGGGDQGASPNASSLGGSPSSPARDKLNASLASTALSNKAAGKAVGAPIIDADKIVLYAPADLYTATQPASDPIKCTTSQGSSLERILKSTAISSSSSSRYLSNDLFFDILPVPRLQMEQQVHMRAVIADENGEIYTDELAITLPAGSCPPILVQHVFAAARATEKVRETKGADETLRRLAVKSEAFCLVATRENRIVGFWDNVLLSNGAEGCSSDDDEDEFEEREDDQQQDDIGTSSSNSSNAPSEDDEEGDDRELARARRRRVYIKPRKSYAHMRRLAQVYKDNLRPLDPLSFTNDIVYQLRPINLLPPNQSLMRMYVGFCDCPQMQYSTDAPLFNTPVVITIHERDTLSDVWNQLSRTIPESIKGARTEPQAKDGLCIKLVMFTCQALSFEDWVRTPVNDYFIHTKNKSVHKPMLCINKARPKEAQRPRYGSEPKLRLGGGQPPATAAK